ncbi:MAG: nucleotidyltransferase family protein [Chloroflexi bacterium]|nr:nucleotidyltransferase family protein [Chloroflexota bacterium]
MVIAGVVLAAGASSRLGRPKQLLPFRGRPLLEATLARVAQAQLDDVVVVLGGSAAEVMAQVRFGAARPVINSAYQNGQATSLRAGLAVIEGNADAVVFLLGDQPLQSVAVIDRLIAAFHAGAGPIVAPAYGGVRGNPVLFARATYPLLQALTGDQGARPLLRQRPDLVHDVAVDESAPPADIDTWDDYRAVLRAAGEPDPGPDPGPEPAAASSTPAARPGPRDDD